MELVRDKPNYKIIINNNNNKIIEMYFIADEFCFIVNTNDIIYIDESFDEEFYNGLKKIMDSDYEFGFPSELTSKINNKLVWYCDIYGDVEDKSITDRNSRLHIELVDKVFKIWAENPMYKKLNLDNKSHLITFSPGGNGQKAVNKQTYSNLQDELVINLFVNILNSKEKTKKLNKDNL